MTRRSATAVLLAAFAGCVLAANYLTARHGFVPVGFGLTATAGTYAAGLTFGIRDALHEAAGRRIVVVAIFAGSVLSWAVAPSLAIASGASFLIGELADLAVYSPLRRRRWVAAVILSNLAGAAVDTVLFLHLAGFPIASALPGQMVGKALMVAPAVLLVGGVRRALLRHRIGAEGA